jgi:UDP-N-acetyl-D-mannosaminuronate dehydrogenase
MLGLAYKKNTGDAREAPGTVIVELLTSLGADVRVADPHLADLEGAAVVELSESELTAADAVIIVTDHDAFDYDLIGTHGAYILDTRNRLHGPNVERL